MLAFSLDEREREYGVFAYAIDTPVDRRAYAEVTDANTVCVVHEKV